MLKLQLFALFGFKNERKQIWCIVKWLVFAVFASYSYYCIHVYALSTEHEKLQKLFSSCM